MGVQEIGSFCPLIVGFSRRKNIGTPNKPNDNFKLAQVVGIVKGIRWLPKWPKSI